MCRVAARDSPEQGNGTAACPKLSGVTETYPQRHLDPENARAYAGKFERTALRRLSSRRERAILRAAVAEAVQLLPDVLPADGPRLLDLPCGTGRFAALLSEFVAVYVAADHSPHMLELCRATLARSGPRAARVSFERADARAMPFADDSFDLACCVRLIHHFPDPSERAAILREFARVTLGPLILTFLDAEAPKQWIHARRLALAGRVNRRVVLTRSELAGEALAGGWSLRRTWSLSGLFSGQSVALLAPLP